MRHILCNSTAQLGRKTSKETAGYKKKKKKEKQLAMKNSVDKEETCESYRGEED